MQYFDSFKHEGSLIIVCEWAAAGDLKRQIQKIVTKGKYLSELNIWKYFHQIASAVQCVLSCCCRCCCCTLFLPHFVVAVAVVATSPTATNTTTTPTPPPPTPPILPPSADYSEDYSSYYSYDYDCYYFYDCVHFRA